MGNKILYIEDNPLNIRLVRKILQNAGYELIEAENGLLGIDKAHQEMPSLILMDINLPDIDGLEVASRLRASTQVSSIPIIALTANAMIGDKERFLKAGCDAYLSKPISKNELVQTVSSFF